MWLAGDLSLRRSGLNARQAYARFVVHKVTLEQVFLRVLPVFCVPIIPSERPTHFCRIATRIKKKRLGEAWEPSNKTMLFRISGGIGRKSTLSSFEDTPTGQLERRFSRGFPYALHASHADLPVLSKFRHNPAVPILIRVFSPNVATDQPLSSAVYANGPLSIILTFSLPSPLLRLQPAFTRRTSGYCPWIMSSLSDECYVVADYYESERRQTQHTLNYTFGFFVHWSKVV